MIKRYTVNIKLLKYYLLGLKLCKWYSITPGPLNIVFRLNSNIYFNFELNK